MVVFMHVESFMIVSRIAQMPNFYFMPLYYIYNIFLENNIYQATNAWNDNFIVINLFDKQTQ